MEEQKKIVGTSAARVDAPDKVTGRAKYTDDICDRGAYVAKVLHSTIANGKVKSIDTSPAEQLPGVIKVVTCFDVPKNYFPTAGHSWSTDANHQDVADRLLLTDRVRFYGDDVAAVIAEDEVTAAQAVRAIRVEYEEYPFVLDTQEAMEEDTPLIHEEYPNNILAHTSIKNGDYKEAIKEPGLIKVEGWYDTPSVQHCHIENFICYAYEENSKIHVVSSTQIPHIVRRVVGQALGIPWGKVRVVKPYIGGGFGNKQDALYEPLCAYLSTKVGGHMVKLDMSREETFACTRVRHAIRNHIVSYVRPDGTLSIGKNVVVIGGGNTAMDTARAAKQCEGVEHVYLVYRRTKRYMPADEHELLLALEDGIIFRELLAPIQVKDGQLVCHKTKLGAVDASGRASVVETDEVQNISADSMIAAVGESVPTEFYLEQGICVDEKGKAKVSTTLETNIQGVYIIGDGLYGPSLVVKGMANAKIAAEAIVGHAVSGNCGKMADKKGIYGKKGILAESGVVEESKRCLSCSIVCENCVDVCPNRANLSIVVPGMAQEQVVHVDYMCNECGNCKSFCPYASAPYLDKFTVFANVADMGNSKNDGFAVLDKEKIICKARYLGETFDYVKGQESTMPIGLQMLMETICKDYSYVF